MKSFAVITGSLLVAVLQIFQGPGVLSDRTLLSCSFETSCGLDHTPDSKFYWSRIGGATPNQNTGPTNDHTLRNAQGKYIYAPSSKGAFDFGTRSTLYSPEYRLTSGRGRLEFYYHMLDGSLPNDMGTLAVYVCGSNEPLWSRSRNQGNQWRWSRSLEFSCQQTFRVYLVASRGKYQSDIAVDDLMIIDVFEDATTPTTTTILPTAPPTPTTEPIRITTVKSTTLLPTTVKSTTLQPTTTKSTTLQPTTVKSTTLQPTTTKSTTLQPTTVKSTTLQPTTVKSTTLQPTTVKSTTLQPATVKFTTLQPTTVKSTTFQPTTVKSTTLQPTTVKSTTLQPTTTAATMQRAPPTMAKMSTTRSPTSTTTKRSTTTKMTSPPTTEYATKSETTELKDTSRSVAPRESGNPSPTKSETTTEIMATSRYMAPQKAASPSPRITRFGTTVVKERTVSSLPTKQPVSTVFNKTQPPTVLNNIEPRIEGGSSFSAIGPIVVVSVAVVLIAITACLAVQRKKRNSKSTEEEQLFGKATDKPVKHSSYSGHAGASTSSQPVGLTNYTFRELLELSETDDDDTGREMDGKQKISGGTPKKHRGESVLYTAIPDQSAANNELYM